MSYEPAMEKEYGPHKWPQHDMDHTVDCEYGCGMSVGSSRSGGGILDGELAHHSRCPKNPLNGVQLGGDRDLLAIVAQDSRDSRNWASRMEALAAQANARLGEGAVAIAEHRDKLLGEGMRVNHMLGDLSTATIPGIDLSPPPKPGED